jgi:hypothetical protein
MKTYRYPDYFRAKRRSYISLVFALVLVFGVIGTVIANPRSLLEDLGSGMLVIAGVFAFVTYDLYEINMYPNLTTSEKGLGIEFLGFYLPVSWEDVESVHMTQSASYPEKFTEWFVRTKKLTPFHLLYGKFKYDGYVTGFLMHSEMENYGQILDEIKGKVPANKYQLPYKT